MGGESSADRPRAAKRAFSDTFAAPILLGAMFTAAFYGAIAVLPPDWTFLRRYFCNHALEYASAGLFFVGLGTLLLKWSKLGGERAELRSDLATDLETHDMSGEQLQQALDGITGLRSQTWLVRRLRDASAFVRSRGTSSGLEDHLRYLGELATDQLSRSYALVRTITWAVPILGFLGTVIGITMAIANVTPEQLDSSLGEVTGGLAVAFDTTALALALSIVLVFAQFLVERTEQQLLADVEDFSMRNLPVLYGAGTSGGGTDVLQAASARSLATALDSFVERQMELWNEQLGQLRQRWAWHPRWCHTHRNWRTLARHLLPRLVRRSIRLRRGCPIPWSRSVRVWTPGRTRSRGRRLPQPARSKRCATRARRCCGSQTRGISWQVWRTSCVGISRRSGFPRPSIRLFTT